MKIYPSITTKIQVLSLLVIIFCIILNTLDAATVFYRTVFIHTKDFSKPLFIIWNTIYKKCLSFL